MSLALPPSALRDACDAWERGGCQSLGLWLQHYKPKFSVRDYGDLVQLVREELGDETDYSERDAPAPRPNEYAIPADATPIPCRSCGAGMVFIRTQAGKALPLSVATIEERDGVRYALPHFADCKDSKLWSKK